MLKDRRIQAALVSIGVNIVLATIKFWGAAISQSQGLRADALHSLSDVGVSSLVFLSVFTARKSRKWGKAAEEAVAFSIGVIIVGVAVSVLLSPNYTFGGEGLTQLPLVIGLTWVCILLSYFVSKYKLRVGRECDAANLRADGQHSRMDMYSSVAVLIGLVGAWSGLNLDGIASLVVGLLILRIGLVVLAATLQSAVRGDVAVAEAVDRFEHVRQWGALLSGLFARLGLAPELPEQYLARVRGIVARRKRMLGVLALAALALGYAATGLYVVGPDELGVLTQFGKLKADAVPPGLHYRVPPPFSTVYLAKPDRVYQLEFGFRTVGRRGVTPEPKAYLWESRHMSGIYEKRLEEAIMLTGDKNEVDLNLTLEYRLLPAELPRFFFQAGDPDGIVRALTQRSIQQVVGRMELASVLTTDRNEIEAELREAIQPRLDELGLGVRITGVRLQDVHPPTEVVRAFRAVATAREERATLIHRAEAYRNETLPEARGSAAYLRRDAEAYVEEKRVHTEGDASYFEQLAAAFRDGPEAVRFVHYLRVVEEALAGARKVVFDDAMAEDEAASALSQYFLGMEFLKWPSEPPVREAAPEEPEQALTADEWDGEANMEY